MDSKRTSGRFILLVLAGRKASSRRRSILVHKGGIRGLKIPRLLFPEILFPKMEYDSPMKVELKLIEK